MLAVLPQGSTSLVYLAKETTVSNDDPMGERETVPPTNPFNPCVELVRSSTNQNWLIGEEPQSLNRPQDGSGKTSC